MVITQPRSIEPQTAIGHGVPVLVIAPRSPHGQKTAQDIHRALLSLGAKSELHEDPEDAVMRTARGPVILVGNLADSRCIRWLYYRSLCSTDLWYPGPGGHELRTLCNPFGSGHNLIHVGYSDEDGARIAGERLLANLADPIPHLKDLHATQLPLSALEANEPLPATAPEIVNSWQGDIIGYMYYLTGEAALGETYKQAWLAYISCGFDKNASIVQTHLYSLIRFLPWRVVENMDLFTNEERLAITQFIYGWAESGEGWRHVAACKRTQRPNNQRQNHEMIPSLALMQAAEYFELFYPEVEGPKKWREVAATTFAPYGSSWKPLCDGLCHGWWLSQPVMFEQAVLDPTQRYFTEGGARQAAEAALALVNNDGWLPSAGDTDIKRQFPGIVLRLAADYYGDGRYKYAHDLATPDRRFTWPIVFPRAFAGSVAAKVPDDMVGVTVVPVDPLVYHIWEREPELAFEAVSGPPSAPIEQCFDKLSVRTGWNLADDFLLIDGLGGGSHSYDDAGGVLEYARLGASIIVQEDSFVHSAPEHHSVVTIVRDGDTGVIPGFAILEEHSTDIAGTIYLRIRSKDHAGTDWVREVHLLPGKCAVFVDTVTANIAGDYAIEARFRTPNRLLLDGAVASGKQPSPCCDEVEVRLQSMSDPTLLNLAEVPVHLRYPTEREKDAWCERYHTKEMVLTSFTARETAHLEPGDSVRLVHLTQGRAPDEPNYTLEQKGLDLAVAGGANRISIPTAAIRQPQAAGTGTRTSTAKEEPQSLFATDSAITAFHRSADGALVVGTQKGTLTQVQSDGHQNWSSKLEGPVHAIGSTPGLVVTGHGPAGVTAIDAHGDQSWTTQIVRDPCPWPWWELSSPSAIQVAGGVADGEAFFAVGCGDIQMRCFDGKGQERWRWRYNEGVPGRIVVTDIDGSGEPRIVVGGDILTDVSTCRILTPQGKQVSQMAVEGWTSMLTALAFGQQEQRHFLSCGANRGNNLHLFELEDGEWKRLWQQQLGGQVNGIAIFGAEERILVATSQGFLLGFDLAGNQLWHAAFPHGLQHMVPVGKCVLTVDAAGALGLVSLSGDVEALPSLPGPCAHVVQDDHGIYFACGTELLRYDIPSN